MPRFLRAAGTLLGTLALLLGAGCGGSAGAGATTGQPGQLRIVTAFYPLQFVAERVAGQHAQITGLTEPGAEPHDLELTPQQVASIGEADLVVYEKTFQPAVDEAIAQSGTTNALDTTTVVPLQALGAGHSHAEEGAPGPTAAEGHAAEGHAAGDEHAGDEHGNLDPHVWLDPTRMAGIAQAVADRLSALDADRAADYAANAAALRAALTGLDREFSTGLQACERREFITTHDAFGYLAKRYRLTQIPISGLSPDAEPSPARIAEVQREAKEHRITTIFYETLVSPAVAEAIASDLGLKTDVLDPLEGITAQSKGQDYLSVMKANLAALKAANGCR